MEDKAESDKTRLSNRSGLFGCLGALGVLALGIAGFMALLAFRTPPGQQAPSDRAPVVLTTPLSIKNGPVTINGSGFVSPVRELALAFRVAGVVAEVSPSLEPGAMVEAGAMLVRLDTRPFEAALAQARGDRAAAQADLVFQNRQIERTRRLNQSGYAAEERLDQFVSQRDQAKARIAQLDGLILERELNLEYATLTAPFTGRIISESAATGAIVQTGAEIARAYATDALEITIPLESRKAALINGVLSASGVQPDMAATATVSVEYAEQIYEWTGSVFGARPDIVPDTRTVNVIVRVSDPETPGQLKEADGRTPNAIEAPVLRPGMFASVAITGESVENQATLPRRALRVNKTVWAVTSDDTLKVVPVSVITEKGDEVTVKVSGLEDGTPIVVSSLPFVSDGMRVRIVAADEAETAGTARFAP